MCIAVFLVLKHGHQCKSSCDLDNKGFFVKLEIFSVKIALSGPRVS